MKITLIKYDNILKKLIKIWLHRATFDMLQSMRLLSHK